MSGKDTFPSLTVWRINAGIWVLLANLLVLSLLVEDAYAQRKKRILVLHSYHQGLEWTDNITRGIQSAFAPFQKRYEIHYEYLDSKRNAGREYIEEVTRFISTINKNITYEAIIATDNNALKMINEGKITFSGQPPIVFCGINNYSKELTSSIGNVTGITEKTDHQATLELMFKLHPDRRHVLVIVDNTPTGDAIREELKAIEPLYENKVDFEYYRDFLLEDVPAKLEGLGKNDIIYLTTFNRDRKNNFISYTEGIEMIQRSTDVPIYGSWDFYLGKGVVGGKITSGFYQGQAAGALALSILQGYQAKDLAVVTSGQTRYMFDYEQLQKYGISELSLPNDSIIINSPPTAFEKYKAFLLGITVLSIFIAVVILWKYRRQQSILKAKHALAMELEKQVHERTRALEVANQELARLSNLDALTNIYNRRYFDDVLQKEIHRLQRASSHLSLLFCDIDFFKMYNDTYGHVAGDGCIHTIAKAIQAHCKRDSDVVARYGGEEFGVILPNTNAEEAVAIAEAICRDIEQKQIAHSASPIKDVVSISIGVASLVPDVHTSPRDLIELVDEALYQSKRNGRDQVSLKLTAGDNSLNPITSKLLV
ncbi:MAG: ABC transporter substrate binding protein [Candidatus Thiodiazotropha sp.]